MLIYLMRSMIRLLLHHSVDACVLSSFTHFLRPLQMRKKFSLGPPPPLGTPGIGELYPGSKLAVSTSTSSSSSSSSISSTGRSSGGKSKSSSHSSSHHFHDSSLPGGMQKYLSGANANAPPPQRAPAVLGSRSQRSSSSPYSSSSPPSSAAGMMSIAGRGVAGFLERSMNLGALSHSNYGFKVSDAAWLLMLLNHNRCIAVPNSRMPYFSPLFEYSFS